MVTYCSLLSTHGRVDTELAHQYLAEVDNWKQVLKRVVAVARFLAERGLPFRGDDSTFGSPHNGNFPGSIELLAQFDPFIAEHVAKFGNKGRGYPSYLSSTICDEFIELMADYTLAAVVKEIKDAKYFSFIVDSTPDVSHVDQLTFTVRYVTETAEIAERFLKFVAIHGHTAARATSV